MTIYILLLFTAIVLPLFYKERYLYNASGIIEAERKPMSYFVCISVIMICIIGLRNSDIGIDTSVYEHLYRVIGKQSFSYILREDVSDKAYYLVTMIFSKLGISFHGFNLVYAAFNVSVISCFIYKKSKIPWISYLIYICFDFFILDLTMMRQTIAMSIVIIAVLLKKDNGVKSFLKFAFTVYIASLFHASAIICISIWFVGMIRGNKKLTITFLILIVAAYIFKAHLVSIFNRVATSVSDRYIYGANTGTAGMRLYLMILVSVVYGALSNDFLHDKNNQFLWYMMCIMLMIFPAVQTGGAAMRVYFYFYIFIVVYIPNVLDSIRKKNNKSAIYIIMLLLYILVGIYVYRGALTQNFYLIVPYKFFWQ